MTLTKQDYQNIYNLMDLEPGKGYVEYEKEGETLCIDYDYEEEGYVEDHYYNGTGAYVTTYQNLCIEKVESWNEDGDETENNFDDSILERMAA